MMTTSGQAGALIAGRYRLERPTGGGTWPEEIWQGFDETLNRPVMMRLLPIEGDAEPALEEQVQSVVAQVARLGHPNIAQVYDVGHEGSLRYVISEWTGGRTLGQIMATGRQPWQRTVDWGEQIAEALAALHTVGLVDGVLGPDTVSVMDDRRVKLTDVGLGAQDAGSGAMRPRTDDATQLFDPSAFGQGGDGEATRVVPPYGPDNEATRMVPPYGADDDATRMVPPYGADDPTRVVPSSYGGDADATRVVPGGSRGAVPSGASNDVYALGAILWTAMVGYPPEVGPEDTAGPDLGPLREVGAPVDLAMLLQSMLAASAGLRPSAAVTANRFGALAIGAREPRSEAQPTAVLAGQGATQGMGDATRAVGPLRRRDEDDEYVPPGGAGSSGRRAGIVIGVIVLLLIAGGAVALILSSKSNSSGSSSPTNSVSAPTTSPGQISVSAAPSTSSAPTTTSAAPTTTSASPTPTTPSSTPTSASPSPSLTPSSSPSASDSPSASPSDTVAAGGTTSTSTSTATSNNLANN
jgi:serine/threonine-protein kinase